MKAARTNQNQPHLDIINPHSGDVIYSVPEATPAEMDHVFDNARKAFQTIKKMSVRERLDAILSFGSTIEKNTEEIMERIYQETGKTRMELTFETLEIIATVNFYNEHAEEILADKDVEIFADGNSKTGKTFYEPMGPVLVISPWNFPFILSMNPTICAMVAGNPVILKPSEYTPLYGLYEKLIEESELPEHMLQIVYGGKETGSALIDREPAKIIFTGSIRGGKAVMKHAADYLIPVELELGGKDPLVVLDDANIDRAVEGALWGSMVNTGQVCVSTERLYVHEKVYDEFVNKFVERAKQLKTPRDIKFSEDQYNLEIGGINTDFQLENIKDQIEDAKIKGASILMGGHEINEAHSFEPTVVTDVTDDMKIAKEETFGPVVTVTKFSSDEEAIELANNTEYGLDASVWTSDTDRGTKIAHGIESGNCTINNVMTFDAALPFGGSKHSGFGRYMGEDGLIGFSNKKSIIIDQSDAPNELFWFPYTEEKLKKMMGG